MGDSLFTIRDFIRWGVSRFNEAGLVYGHGTDNALDESISLVFHALHLDHDLPESFLESRLTEAERTAVREILERRLVDRKPAPYLVGRARFAGLEFHVNEEVLVPRSPIAELIEEGYAPWVDHERVRHIQRDALLYAIHGQRIGGDMHVIIVPHAVVKMVDTRQLARGGRSIVLAGPLPHALPLAVPVSD